MFFHAPFYHNSCTLQQTRTQTPDPTINLFIYTSLTSFAAQFLYVVEAEAETIFQPIQVSGPHWSPLCAILGRELHLEIAVFAAGVRGRDILEGARYSNLTTVSASVLGKGLVNPEVRLVLLLEIAH